MKLQVTSHLSGQTGVMSPATDDDDDDNEGV